MKPKQLRDRLFKGGRPHIRPLEVFSEEGYGKDMGVLWAAYKTGSFEMEDGLDQAQFADQILASLGGFDMAWMVEDHNKKYSSGEGCVGVVAANFDGWQLTPRFEPFSWATLKNKVRGVASFLQMMRYQRDIGVVLVDTTKNESGFFTKLKRYGVLNFAGRIPNGLPNGDRYLFYISGRKGK